MLAIFLPSWVFFFLIRFSPHLLPHSCFCSHLVMLELKGHVPQFFKKISSHDYLLCINNLHACTMLFFQILKEHCEGVIKAVCFSSTFCLFFLFIIRCDDTFACVASHRWHRNFVIKW